jgi:hypothetical protein
LELEDWKDVSPRGSATEEEDGYQLLNYMLRTNQLSVNMQLLGMALAGIVTRVKRGHVQLEEVVESLGGQTHYTNMRLDTKPGMFASSEDSVLDGIATIQGNFEGLEASIISQDMSDMREEMQCVLQDIKSEVLATTHANFNQLVAPLKSEAVLMRKELSLLKQDNQSLRAAQSGVSHAFQGLDPKFAQDWTHVLDFFMKYTSAGAGSMGDLMTEALESRDSPHSVAPAPAAAAQLSSSI